VVILPDNPGSKYAKSWPVRPKPFPSTFQVLDIKRACRQPSQSRSSSIFCYLLLPTAITQ